MIPLVNLQRQHEALRHEIEPALSSVLASADFILGSSVAQFEEAAENGKTPMENSQALNELMQANPDAFYGVAGASALILGGAATGLAAIVCGIIGSRRRARRWAAIVALAISFLPILLCLGSAVG